MHLFQHASVGDDYTQIRCQFSYQLVHLSSTVILQHLFQFLFTNYPIYYSIYKNAWRQNDFVNNQRFANISLISQLVYIILATFIADISDVTSQNRFFVPPAHSHLTVSCCSLSTYNCLAFLLLGWRSVTSLSSIQFARPELGCRQI